MNSKPHSPARIIRFIVPGLALMACAVSCPALTISGQLSLQGNRAHADPDSVLAGNKERSLYDGSSTLRLMAREDAGRSTFAIHYEISAAGGDFFERTWQLDNLLPGMSGMNSSDSLKVFDLDAPLKERPRYRLQHRIDRLSYQYYADWGTITLGRDVITWGNGLVFNPLDLINPFAPTDIQRDYKAGDDLLLIDLFAASWNGNMDWQFLAVPHRHPETGDLDLKTSSFALKAHFFKGSSEWDLLAAMHYDEVHLGVGSVHTVGGAVVRLDVLAGFPENDETRVSAVLNIDYSWTTAGLNTYGLLEYYYQSVGVDSLQEALREPGLLARLERGEIHTYGRHYLSAALQLELHPLLQARVQSILNIGDRSLNLQPYLIWDLRQNMQVALGAQVQSGDTDTLFTWVKWYF